MLNNLVCLNQNDSWGFLCSGCLYSALNLGLQLLRVVPSGVSHVFSFLDLLRAPSLTQEETLTQLHGQCSFTIRVVKI